MTGMAGNLDTGTIPNSVPGWVCWGMHADVPVSVAHVPAVAGSPKSISVYVLLKLLLGAIAMATGKSKLCPFPRTASQVGPYRTELMLVVRNSSVLEEGLESRRSRRYKSHGYQLFSTSVRLL